MDARNPLQRRQVRRPPGGPGPKVRPQLSGPARVELILVGRELLLGQIADTNGPVLARYCAQRAAVVDRITTVGDDEPSIAAAIREALGRNPNLVITTGGLGPAVDDRTLAAVAAVLHLPLAPNHEAREMVEAAYQRLRQKRVLHKGGLTLAREKMYQMPIGGEPVPNPLGIAPGVICRIPGGSAVLCLPGLPEEMLAALDAAGPRIKLGSPDLHVAQREIESPTSDESSLLPLLDQLSVEFPGVWIHSHPAGSRRTGSKIMISLEARGANQREADVAVEGVVKRLLALAAGSP